MNNPVKPRSSELTEGVLRIGHRALLHASGLSREDLGKPFVGVVNSWNEIVPGCIHLRDLADAVKEGVRSAGGVPFEFNTIAVCDGLAQGHPGMRYSLPSREVIAASIEIMLEAHRFDAAVFISSCDKVTPGMLMAAALVDMPALFVTAGHMEVGSCNGAKYTLSSLRELVGNVRRGELSEEDLAEIELAALPGPGTCAMLGTANSMACIAEAMGLTLPLSSTTSATSAQKTMEARRAGERIVAMVRDGPKVSRMFSTESLENGLRVTMALGGSTNSILHLLALSSQLGLSIDLRRVDEISRSTPYLVQMAPSGPNTMDDLHAAGGIPALLRALGPLIATDVPTVNCRSLGEEVQRARWQAHSVIRSPAEPIAPDGGVAVLFGNLAPEGALVKKAGVAKQMWRKTGPALVFDRLDEAMTSFGNGEVPSGSVVVIRYQGPVGGPGMPEMHLAASTMSGLGLASTTAIVTDGRFSGATRGPCIGYVCPEAATGGPIGLVVNGDIISFDMSEGRLDLSVADEELARRRNDWRQPDPPRRGILSIYSQLAGPASRGASWQRPESHA